MSKSTFKGHVDLLLIGKESIKHYVVIKDFITIMYDPNNFVIVYKLILQQKY